MHQLLREEEQESRNSNANKHGSGKSKRHAKPSLVGDKLKVQLIADTLCSCYIEEEKGKRIPCLGSKLFIHTPLIFNNSNSQRDMRSQQGNGRI
jgi:hypothetical protein